MEIMAPREIVEESITNPILNVIIVINMATILLSVETPTPIMMEKLIISCYLLIFLKRLGFIFKGKK